MQSRTRAPREAAILAILAAALLVAGSTSSRAGDAPAAGGEAAAAPVVKEIVVRGNALVPDQRIVERMRTRVGEPLDRETLDGDFDRIFKLGAFSDMQILEEEVEGGIRVVVKVEEKAIVRRIVFRGNRQVSDKRLSDLVNIQLGERFDAGRANAAVRAMEDWYREEFYYFTDVDFETEPFEDGVRLVFTVKEGGRVQIEDIVFHGNDAVDRKTLLKHMETKASTFFNRGRFERDVFERDLERLRLLYQSKGFLDARVQERPFQITAEAPDSRWQKRVMVIHIDIEEGPVYRIGEIRFEVEPVEGGEPIYGDPDFREAIVSMPGDPYSPLEVNKDTKRIRDLYGEKGRIFTRVSAKRQLPEEGQVADVIFEIRESAPIRVGEILITGLEKTEERVVRREMELYPGEVFSSKSLKESIRNLNRLNFFKQLDVNASDYVKEGTAEDQANILVDLDEVRTGQFSAGVGLSSAAGVVGMFSLKQRNFDHRDHPDNIRDLLTGNAYTGAGEYLGFEAQAGTDQRNYELNFVNPWIFNRPIRFGMGGFYRDYDWYSQDETRTGAYFLLGRNIFGKNWDISAKYSIESVEISNLVSDASQVVRDEEGDNWISRMTFQLAYDSRDNIFSPTKGWYAYAAQEVAGGVFGGTKDFWRSSAKATHFWTFHKDEQERPHVLAMRGEVAFANEYGDSDNVPFYERWYAGGIGSLRGFDYHTVGPQDDRGDAIGGEGMMTASVEYFFPIFTETVRGSVFYDTGTVWAQYDDMDSKWRSAAGVGLHMRTPLGPMPVRIYVGKPLSKEDGDDTATVQFNIGAYF
ncbi:MAG: outer membrane protein assembly factor BamA [Planctomycetota bacterium]